MIRSHSEESGNTQLQRFKLQKKTLSSTKAAYSQEKVKLLRQGNKHVNPLTSRYKLTYSASLKTQCFDMCDSDSLNSGFTLQRHNFYCTDKDIRNKSIPNNNLKLRNSFSQDRCQLYDKLKVIGFLIMRVSVELQSVNRQGCNGSEQTYTMKFVKFPSEPASCLPPPYTICLSPV